MEFITVKNKEQNIYTIPNNLNNKYIIQFLNLYDLINSITDDLITFEVDSIEFIKDNVLPDKFGDKFIYDIGYQLMVLKENKLGVKYMSPNDIVRINSNIFLFVNPNMLFELLNKKHVKTGNFINSYEYGIVERNSLDLESKFIAPELSQDSDYIYYTCSFYSFAKLFQALFNLDVGEIFATSVYYFLQRCLEKKPENRIFLYV